MKVVLWLVSVLVRVSSQADTGPICYACERSENPEYCRESVTCSPSEVCDWLSEGVVDAAAIIGKRQTSMFQSRCVYCCAQDLCNKNCSSFVNLALRKPAYQSSVSWNGTADLAVDGDTTKNYFEGSCTHNAKEQNPWWAVDLQDEYHITKVKLHERDDAGADGRSFHLTVLVSSYNATQIDADSNLFTTCGGYVGHSSEGNTITIDCPQNTQGRWVRIQQTYSVSEYFHLCEVEVFGF